MSKVPSLPYTDVIRVLQRAGWVVVRQKGSHVRLQKHTPSEVLKLTGDTEGVHDPVIIKQKDTYYVFCTGGGRGGTGSFRQRATKSRLIRSSASRLTAAGSKWVCST